MIKNAENQEKFEPKGNVVSIHKPTLADLEKCRLTESTEIKPHVTIVKIGEQPFAVSSDVSVIGGQPKAGKTSISTFILASAFLPEGHSTDTLQIQTAPANGRTVVYIDTEQTLASTDKLRRNIKKLLGKGKEEELPENLHIYNLRKFADPATKQAYVKAAFGLPNLHLLIVDGVADLLTDPNNVSESFKLISDFMSLASIHEVAVIFYLHENPGTSKMRGNLGSEVERKCWGALAVKKDRENKIHIMESKLMRGSGDFDPILFRYDVDKGHMVSVDESEAKDLRDSLKEDSKKRKRLEALADQCTVGGSEHVKHAEFVRRIVTHHALHMGTNITENTGKKRIKEMVDLGIIEKDADNKYCLVKMQSVPVMEVPVPF